MKQPNANTKLAERRERDRARRQAKRTAEVWAMPADEVIAKYRAERTARSSPFSRRSKGC